MGQRFNQLWLTFKGECYSIVNFLLFESMSFMILLLAFFDNEFRCYIHLTLTFNFNHNILGGQNY